MNGPDSNDVYLCVYDHYLRRRYSYADARRLARAAVVAHCRRLLGKTLRYADVLGAPV